MNPSNALRYAATALIAVTLGGSISAATLREVDFDNHGDGTYTKSLMSGDFAGTWENGLSEGRGIIVAAPDAYSGKSLRIEYPADKYGSNESGAQWKGVFASSDSVYLEYKVKFEAGFDFVKGGKLPGVCGGDCNSGSIIPDGTDGWSARFMWRADGRLSLYLYHMDQPDDYGHYIDVDAPTFTPGTWYTIRQFVKLNSPGNADGVIKVWVNDQLGLTRSNLRFRTTSSLQIDRLFFSTFFGGSTAEWAPSKDEYVFFDDFKVYNDGGGTGPVNGTTTLIDDFEDGVSRRSIWNGIWYAFDDSSNGGKSTITVTMNDVGGYDNTVSQFVDYTLDKGDYAYDPFVGIGLYLTYEKEAYDISQSTGIRLRHKGGNNSVILRIETPSVAAEPKSPFHRVTIPATTEWDVFEANWEQFLQPAWSGVVPSDLDLTQVSKISIQIRGDRYAAAPETGSFAVDNIELLGTVESPNPVRHHVMSPAANTAGLSAELTPEGHVRISNLPVGARQLGLALHSLSGELLHRATLSGSSAGSVTVQLPGSARAAGLSLLSVTIDGARSVQRLPLTR